jgi:hypothetical protein
MNQHEAILNKLFHDNEQDILEFFAAANNQLIKRKLEKYNIAGGDVLSIQISSENIRVPFLNGARLFDYNMTNRGTKESVKNSFKSKLKAKCMVRKSY